MSHISTHILDTSRGKPAAGVAVVLERLIDANWSQVNRATTDGDGRIAALLPAGSDGVATSESFEQPASTRAVAPAVAPAYMKNERRLMGVYSG